MRPVMEPSPGYTDTPMDQEMDFPNPLVRTDLPVKRRRWPRILLAGTLLLILGVVFLPQILSSKAGRKFVVNAITSRTRSEVTLATFKTSWFGGTQVTFLNIKDSMGRRIGCKSLTCQAGLWKLLRNNFQLGDTTVEGLHLDWVVDDGRGNGTGAQINSWTNTPPGQLPRLSGKIKINSGTIVLYRGTVQPKLYNVSWEQAKIENVAAELDIKSLDQPWTFSLDLDPLDDNGQRGTLSSSGTVELGQGGWSDGASLSLDVTVEAKDLPTGPLGAALIPGADEVEVRQVFGPVLNSVKVIIKAADGKLNLTECTAKGPGAQISLPASFNMTSKPAVMTTTSAATISCGISNRLARDWLVYLNPFLRDAPGGAGRMNITFDNFSAPLGGPNVATMAAGGTFSVQDVALARLDEMRVGQALPERLCSQLALVTGDSQPSMPLTIPQTAFSITAGQVVLQAHPGRIGSHQATFEGITGLDGALRQTVTLDSKSLSGPLAGVPSGLALPISGTIDKPQLGVLTPRTALPDPLVKALSEQVNAQVAKMTARENQRLMQNSQQKVDDLLRPLQGPSTSPAKNDK